MTSSLPIQADRCLACLRCGMYHGDNIETVIETIFIVNYSCLYCIS